MSDDKPKHKPQQKHTLSEVLKSLQDLIRTDLIATPSPEPAEAPQANPSASPSSPADPDSFNDSLDQLDRMITEKIIDPATRADTARSPEPEAEPEPEIEWNDDMDFEAGADNGRQADETGDEWRSRPEFDAPEEVIDLEPLAEPEQLEAAVPFDSDEPIVPTDEVPEHRISDAGHVAPEGDRTETTIEPEQPPEPDVTDEQRAFDFPEREDGAEPPSVESVAETRSSEHNDVFEPSATVASDDDSPIAPSDPDMMSTDLCDIAETPVESTAPPQGDAVDRISLETSPMTTVEDPREAAPDKPAHEAPASAPPEEAGMDDASHLRESGPATDDETAPENRRQDAATTPQPGEASMESPAANAEPPTLDEEIPVLQDIADVEAPPSPPLPDAAQARDIAIRVIARLNIERRKTGEAPLDIKTIERLQQYLADALTKRAMNKPK